MAVLNRVFLLLGSNIEPRIKYLEDAKKLIGENIGAIKMSSRYYESKALGFTSETNFVNQVLELEIDLSATETLLRSLEVETKLGRIRVGKGYSSRTIDIDILYYNYLQLDIDKLIIPHPRLHKRRFTLMPLVEIAPDFIHPVFNKTNSELLHLCEDNSVVKVCF